MTVRFSPSTLGWYPTFVNYTQLPNDLIEVSDELYRSLLGKQIEMGPDGPREVAQAPVSEIPVSVTMRQARLALLSAVRLGMVDLVIAGLPSPQREAAQIEWEFAATVDRASPLVATLAVATGMNEEELDQLFLLASSF